MAEKYSVEAVLSAVDKNFSSSMKSATSWVDKLTNKASSSGGGIIGMGAAMGVASSVTSSAIEAIQNAVGGLMGDLSAGSATWKTFNSNMKNIGKSSGEIKKVKKDLQDYATQTIYSSSEMATTYSQLTAVGIKGADQLVKGFGGIAAAAEDPKQAMKTLSQQATQMASKPKVEWADFKLMLEQTPAGIAGVAKEMGMSTAKLVSSVQDGTIKTQDFFDAVNKVGTSDGFMKMATQYKTVGQAMDGLQETVVNKLQPSFDKFSQVAIDKISGLVDWVSKLDFDKFIGQLGSGADILAKFAPLLATVGAGASLSGILPALSTMNSGFSAVSSKLPSFSSGIEKATAVGSKLGKSVNLTNFAKGFENARGKLGKFKIGMLDVSDVFDAVDKGVFKASSGIVGLQDKFPKLTAATSKFSSGIGTGIKKSASIGTTALSGMVSGMGSVMSLAMAVLGPAAIVGVVVAGLGVANSQFGDQIDQMINTAVTKGPQIINNLVNSIVAGLPELMNSGTALIAQFSQIFATLLPVVATAGLNILQSLITGLTSNMDSLMASVLTIVNSIGTTILAAAPQLLMMGLSLLLSIVQGISNNSDQIVATVTNLINSFTTNITNNLPAIIDKGIQILTSLASGIVKTIPQLLPVAFQAITTLVSGLADKLPDILNAAVDIIMMLVEGFLDNLPEIASSAGEMITTLLGAIGKALPDIVAKGAELVVNLVKGLWDHKSDIFDAGVDLVQGFINGIGSMISGVVDKAKEMASSAVDTVKGWLHIGSPSKVFAKLGSWTGEGFANGIGGMIGDVKDKAKELANAAMPDMKSFDYDYNASLATSGAISGSISADNNYSFKRPIQVTVVSQIDGRQVSKATVVTDQEEQTKYNRIKNKIKGE